MAKLILDEPEIKEPKLILDEPEVSTVDTFRPSIYGDPIEEGQKAKEGYDLSMKYNIPIDVINSGLFNYIAQSYADPVDVDLNYKQTKYVPRNIYDPTDITGNYEKPKAFEILSPEQTRRFITNPTSKVFWKGLGIIGWPFERVENIIAGAMKPLAEGSAERASLTLDYIANIISGIEPTEEQKEALEIVHFFDYIRKHAVPAYKESYDNLKTSGVALNPWSDVPQKDLYTFTDLYRGYWRGWLNDEEPPEWYAPTAGIGTSFVVTPYVVGKVFKLIGKLGKASPVYKAIQEYRIPEYQAMKKIKRLQTGAGIYDAEQLGKSISKKELTEVVERLSDRIGKPVSESAVQQRLVQIIKGGVTNQPALAEKANPIIEEFRKNAEILRKAGIISEYTYTTKLTKANIKKINFSIAKAQKELDRLQKNVPHQEQLIKQIAALHPDVIKQKKLADKLVEVAIKAEGRGKKLTDISDELLDAAIEVTTGSPLSKKVSTLVDFAPGDKRLTDLGKRILSLEKMERVSRNKEAKNILDIAVKINPKVSKYTQKTVNEILDVASKIENSKIIGSGTLLKYVQKMKYRFPGRADRIRELEETIQNNLDSLHINDIYGGTNYYPRMYLTKEAEKAAKRFPFWGKSRIRASYAKQRETYLQLHPEARKKMGEIISDYPVTKRLIQQGIDIETAKFYEQIATNPSWTSRIALEGFSEIPKDKAYGALAGKYVKNIIARDIRDMNRIKNNIEVMYDTAMGSWKAAVTVWSPSVHFRNMFSNSILLDLSGVDHIEQVKLMKQAINEISNNSDDYIQAKRYLSRGTFSESELMDDLLAGSKAAKGKNFENILNSVSSMSRKMSESPSDIYGKEEFVGKFIKYLSERNKGKDVISAAKKANEWLFDYGDLAQWEKTYARRLMPFYTFPRKAIPKVVESMANNPYAIAKYPMFVWGMEKYSLHQLNLTEDDYAQIKAIMPDYMKSDSYMLLPYRDANGDLRFFDFTYLLPWGTISDFQERGMLNVVVSNPLIQVVGDIQRNKDSFSGRKIWEDTDTNEEIFIKKVTHVWQGAVPLPPWFPGGRYYDRIYEAATGKPSKKWDILLDKEPLLPEAIAHTAFGLRTVPFDVNKQTYFYWQDKQDKFSELEAKISDAFIQKSSGNITDKELQSLYDQYIEQMTDLLSED